MRSLLLSVFVLLGVPGEGVEGTSNNADASVFTEECLAETAPTAASSDVPFPGMLPGMQSARVFDQTGVVVLAATNRPEVLDSALLRPGRLDRRVHVGLPAVLERRAIIEVHTRGKRVDDALDLNEVAKLGSGIFGAQLEQLCNEAALLAARGDCSSITEAHFSEAIEYVTAGRPRRSAMVAEADRKVAAWHETRHVVTAFVTNGANRPVRVSIIPRGNAGGLTWFEADETAIISRRSLLARLVVALGGRAAEEHLLHGEYTAGASDNLSRASEIARAMVDRFGMSERGLSVCQGSSDASDDTVEDLIQHAATQARILIAENSAFLEAVATGLLESNELSREDIERLGALHAYPTTLEVGSTS